MRRKTFRVSCGDEDMSGCNEGVWTKCAVCQADIVHEPTMVDTPEHTFVFECMACRVKAGLSDEDLRKMVRNSRPMLPPELAAIADPDDPRVIAELRKMFMEGSIKLN